MKIENMLQRFRLSPSYLNPLAWDYNTWLYFINIIVP